MTGVSSATAAQVDFFRKLTEYDVLLPSGVPGIHGRGAVFESVLSAVDDLISRRGPAALPRLERMAFPPVMPRTELERIGYFDSFPHLAAVICSFRGEESVGEKSWADFQQQTDLAMVPAACYPAYPVIAARGPLGEGGVALDLGRSYVFRSEPSGDPARMQMFHQRELVRFGRPEEVSAWRQDWCDRAVEILTTLGLAPQAEVASDPFFGRSGRLLARSQRAQALKFEVLVQIAGDERTAVASFNCHRDYFAALYGIGSLDGEPVHTACVGFGLERISLALFKTHGYVLADWPEDVRGQLWPGAAGGTA